MMEATNTGKLKSEEFRILYCLYTVWDVPDSRSDSKSKHLTGVPTWLCISL